MDNSSYFRFNDDNKTKCIFSQSSQRKWVNWKQNILDTVKKICDRYHTYTHLQMCMLVIEWITFTDTYRYTYINGQCSLNTPYLYMHTRQVYFSHRWNILYNSNNSISLCKILQITGLLCFIATYQLYLSFKCCRNLLLIFNVACLVHNLSQWWPVINLNLRVSFQ